MRYLSGEFHGRHKATVEALRRESGNPAVEYALADLTWVQAMSPPKGSYTARIGECGSGIWADKQAAFAEFAELDVVTFQGNEYFSLPMNGRNTSISVSHPGVSSTWNQNELEPAEFIGLALISKYPYLTRLLLCTAADV